MDVFSPFPLYCPSAYQGDPFDLVLADPPWAYSDPLRCGGRGAEQNYDVHPVEDIERLDVEAVVADDAILAMWMVPPQLEAGFQLMRAWGFTPLTLGFTWIKVTQGPTQSGKALKARLRALDLDRATIQTVVDAAAPYLHRPARLGMGRQTRQNAEFCYLGRRGRGLERLDAGVNSVVFAPRMRHSRKPDEVHRRLERLYGPACRRLELFARRPKPGWCTWGNEIVDGSGNPLQPGVLMPLKTMSESIDAGLFANGDV